MLVSTCSPMVVRRLPERPLPDPLRNPSLADTEPDSLSVRLRAATRAALPELVKSEQRGMAIRRIHLLVR